MSRSICLYLHVHQPYRVRAYTLMDAGRDHNYFYPTDPGDRTNNETIFRKVAEKSYLPTNARLLKLLKRHPDFRLSLSITGTVLEQMEQWSPEVLRSFQQLVDTGRVELVAETYYHSLSFFYSLEEFEHQVEIHTKKLKQLFGYKPKSFRNTELAYNNELAQWADAKGYKAILTEGWEPVLEWRSPNHVYRPAYTNQIRLLMKNYRLSDDIAFRFGNRGWGEWPLTAEKFVHWLDALDPAEDVINLFMDYETFGEHQWDDTGIFNFLEEMPAAFLRNPDNSFVTVTEAAKRFKAKDYIDVPSTITWADTERDLSAWLGNAMQQSALQQLYSLEADVMATRDIGIVGDWRKLTASDHFYYMCTKWFSDGDIHAYFSPYESPYDAYIFTTNALRDLRVRVDQALAAQAAGPKPRGRRPKSLSGRR